MDRIFEIKEWLEKADAIVINSGAGISVDSGIEDYRGIDGQWGKLEKETGRTVFETMNPKYFAGNPAKAWERFACLMQKFSETQPHKGFSLLLKWIKKFNLDYFVLTSNIDGQFQKAGFDDNRIREVHGSLWHLQSIDSNKYNPVWKNELDYTIIRDSIKQQDYPKCPDTDILCRPNVYMFRDNTFNNSRSKAQAKRFDDFIQVNENKNIVVFEIGSGPHVQSIRAKTRMLGAKYGAKIVRINPKDSKIKEPHISIAKGALEALVEIDSHLKLEQ